MNLQMELTKSGDNTLKVIHKDKEFYLHSKYDPTKEAAIWADSFFEKNHLFIIIGFGLGYQAKALLSKMDEKDKLLIIEPFKEIYELAVSHTDIDNVINDKRVVVIVGDNKGSEIQSKVAGLIGQQSFTENKVFIGPNYDKLYPVNEIFENVKIAFMYFIMNLNTVRLFAIEWQENYLKNIKYALESSSLLHFNKKFSIPVVIVSAGPSLTAELEMLKTVYKRALIISAGSATPVLQKNNIVPHIIVSLDGGIPNYNHFKEVKYDTVPLFYSPTIHYKILEEYRGPKVVFQFSSEEVSKWYDEVLEFETGVVHMGPSVANCALDIACRITSGPICLIGQDLGYTGGVSHAEGNIHRVNITDQNKTLVPIEANDGSELMSDYPYISMRDWFENYISICKDERFYNATLKGAKIKGTKVIEFTQFVNEFCNKEVNIKLEIDKILLENKIGPCKAKLNSIRNEMINCLDEIIKISLKGKKIAEQLTKSVKKDDINRINFILLQLNAIDEKLSLMKEKDGILFFIVRPILIKLSFWKTEEDSDAKKDKIAIAEKNYFLYSELNKIAVAVRKMLFDYMKLTEENNGK
jgi:hypothetical protein